MSSILPSRANGYAVELNQTATRAFFEAFLSDIHARFLSLEGTEADYQAAIDAITTQALAIVSANITFEVDRQRETLAAIKAAADEIVLNAGAPASLVSIRSIAGLAAGEVQSALAELLAAIQTRAAKTDVYAKSETFSKEEVYPRSETYSKANVDDALAKLFPKTGGTLTGPLSFTPRDLEALTGGTKTVAYEDGNRRRFELRSGSTVFNIAGIPESGGDLQLDLLYTAGSFGFQQTIKWCIGQVKKSTSINDTKLTLASGTRYSVVLWNMGGELYGAIG